MRLSEQAKGGGSPKDDKTVVTRFVHLTVVIYRTTLSRVVYMVLCGAKKETARNVVASGGCS